MTPPCALNTLDLIERLRLRYPAPAYAFFREVQEHVSAAHGRADAIAMGCWQSKGIELHGFEIKVSPADWNRERRKPSKAETVLSYCDRWWLVVSDPSIVKEGELPEPWGLLAPRGDGLVAVKPAPLLEPRPLDRFFVASVFRHAERQWSPEAGKRDRNEAKVEGFREGLAHAEEKKNETITRLETEVEGLRTQIETFEKACGVPFWTHDVGDIGKAVRMVLDGDAEKVLEHMQIVVDRLAEQIRYGHAVLRARKPKGEDHG